VLELLNLLCRHPEMTISASTAALFRLINLHPSLFSSRGHRISSGVSELTITGADNAG
jgi:hypothetical protein